MTIAGRRQLTTMEREDISEKTTVYDESIRRIFVDGKSATYNSDTQILDNLTKYLKDKNFEYSNWNDFKNKEHQFCPPNIPEKHFYDLSDKQRNIVIHAVDMRMKTLVPPHKINTKPLIHLYTVGNLLGKPENVDLRFLIKNKLLFFTNIELEQQQLLMKFLIGKERTALFIGNPATGKTTSVMELMKLLEQHQYSVYYHSFRNRNRWGDVWSEILENVREDSVFILDDIHLGMEEANEAYAKLETDSSLRLLFISRGVKEHNETELTTLYESLADCTIRTENPSIDAKVKGIVKSFQSYFREENKGEYALGDLALVVRKIHRNLVVLREYLRIWETLPNFPLSKLEETQIYAKMYQHYFPKQGIKESWEKCLLQYLILYYFEIPFRANPCYLPQTEALAENANRIVAEKDRLYSIYHGEYAYLLLKSYRAQARQMDTWEVFFTKQLKSYFLDFESKQENVPNSFLLMNRITYSSKLRIDGIGNTNKIFKDLLTDDQVRNYLLQLCEMKNDDWDIFGFMSSLLLNTPTHFYSFFEKFWKNGQFLESQYSFAVYCRAVVALEKNKEYEDFDNKIKPYLPKLIEKSPLNQINEGFATRLNRYSKIVANAVFQLIKNILLLKMENSTPSSFFRSISVFKNFENFIEQLNSSLIKIKAQEASFRHIGVALIILKNIDKKVAEDVLKTLDKEGLSKKAQEASFGAIGETLIILKSIDKKVAEDVLKTLDKEGLSKKAEEASFGAIDRALNKLKNIDKNVAEDILKVLNKEELAKKAQEASFRDIGRGLNTLKNIDKNVAEDILKVLNKEELAKKAQEASFRAIGEGLNTLKNIDKNVAEDILKVLNKEELAKKAQEASLAHIGNSLNELKNIDKKTAEDVLSALNQKGLLVEKAQEASLAHIGKSLSELKNIDKKIAEDVLKELNKEELAKKSQEASLEEICPSIIELRKVDEIYAEALMKILVLEPSFIKKIRKQIQNWENAKKVDFWYWNYLVISLTLADKENKVLLELIELGFKYRAQILERRGQIATVGTSIRILSEFKKEVIPFVKDNIYIFKSVILKTTNKKHIAGFIRNIHKVVPNEATKYLLGPYQANFPDDMETIGYTYFYLGKNYEESNDNLQVIAYLTTAKIFIEELKDEKHSDTLNEINDWLAK